MEWLKKEEKEIELLCSLESSDSPMWEKARYLIH